MIELDAGGARDFRDRVENERQGAEAEKVHLQQADALDLLHGPLGRDFVASSLVQRRVFRDRLRGDDDARGVHRGVPRHALEPPGDAQQLLHLRVVLLEILQRLALLERLVERHVESRRDQLRDLVHVAERHLEHTADVPHDGLGLHGAERDDLGDVLAPVLPRDVVDDLAPPPLAEVDVDIGQRDALGIQKALEDQIEVDRIDVGDAQAVRHEAAGGRPAPGADRNPLLPRVADEVPDDQEVPGILHPLDHLDLVRERPLVLVDGVAQRAGGGQLLQPDQPLLEPFARHVLEVIVEREVGRHLEVRQVGGAFLER